MTENKRYNRREMINVVIHILKGNLQILKTPRRKTLPRKYILNPIAPEPYIILVREAIKKKTTKFWTLSEKGGGVSAAAKLFIDERYGHVYRGGGVGAPRPN